MGITGKLLAWLENFLSDRKMTVQMNRSYSRFQAFSFLCTFVLGSEKSTERTFAPVELLFRGTSLLETFTPVELSFLGSEHSKNFRSYETVVP